jgi:hypothetical protein
VDQRQDRRALLGNKVLVRLLPKAPSKQRKQAEDDEQVLLTKEDFKENLKNYFKAI